MEDYQTLKARQAEELNDFTGIFFAFSNKQFKEGMESVGLTEKDTDKIYSLGAGGFILKERSQAFGDMFDKHAKERDELKTNRKLLVDALVYELQNHEYGYTGDTAPALEALGLEEVAEDILREACTLAQSN